MSKNIRRPTLLVILDGYGLSNSKINNAITSANTPKLDYYFKEHPNTQLEASGRSVGLPSGQMGNSEVGHLTLGSGTILRQDLVRIEDSIDDESFYENAVFTDAIGRALKYKRPIHLIGLVSDGGVHSHIRHIIALIELCRRHKVRPLLHMITDGRDTAPQSALNYLDMVEPALDQAGGAIATLSGRYFAMDRDKRWDRVEKAWNAMVSNQGRRCDSARCAIEFAYENGENDEFCPGRSQISIWHHFGI